MVDPMRADKKDIIRTIKKGKKRFFSILLITALGATMMTGLKAACVDLRYSADQLYDSQKLFDISVASTLGLDEDDLKELRAVEGVQTAEGEYSASVYTDIDGARQEAEIRTIGESLNRPTVVKGSLPEAANEVAVTESYLADTGKQIGDTLNFDEEEDSDVFPDGVYTITAEVLNPMDVNNREGSVSFRSTSSTDYTIFVPAKAADTEVYTAIYLSLEGSDELMCYTDAYRLQVRQVEDQIEKELKEKRQTARYESVKKEAQDAYDEASEEAMQKLEDARQELIDARTEITDGQNQLNDGKEELKKQEAIANQEFAKAKQQLQESSNQIKASEEQLAASEQELQAGKTALSQARETLEQQEQASLSELESGKMMLQETLKSTQASLQQLQELERQMQQVPGADLTEIQGQIAQAQQGIAQIQAQMETLQQQEKAAKEQFTAGRRQLEEQEAALSSGEQQLADGKVQLEAGKAQLRSGEQALKEQEVQATAKIAESRALLEEKQQELDDGLQKLVDGEQELAENEEKVAGELADAQQEIDDISMAKWYVQGRDSLSGYSNVDNDAISIEGLANFFPLIFFIVAILISLTTITRMVEEDRGLIGTYKALGFKNREIRRKYVVYAASACITGGIVGDLCGFVVLPKIIFVFFRMMYMIPTYVIRPEWVSGIISILLFTGGILIAALWACRVELSHMPAVLMRPQAPKEGSRIFLERIPALWKRFSFLNKVTARNLFRYKKRLIMTVAGIMGCTALLVCGFAIKNTVTELMPLQYEKVNHYDLLAAAQEKDNEKLLTYMDDRQNIESYLNIQLTSVKLSNAEGKEQSVQMFVIPEGQDLETFIRLADQKGKKLSLDDEGILITKSTSDVLGAKNGARLTVRDLSMNESTVEVAGVTENYLGDIVYVSQTYYEAHFGTIEPNAVLVRFTDQCKDRQAYVKQISEKEEIISATGTDTLKAEFSQAFSLMNMVVYVIILMAAGLAFVVLFTLSTTNISERCRELATIKVLGFYDREVHMYVNKETIILSLIGIAFGLPAGYFLSNCLTWALKIPGLYFAVSIYPVSYVFAAVIAFVFTLIVNLITNRLLNVIDPVEALKSVE